MKAQINYELSDSVYINVNELWINTNEKEPVISGFVDPYPASLLDRRDRRINSPTYINVCC